jgi:hypothetical protein
MRMLAATDLPGVLYRRPDALPPRLAVAWEQHLGVEYLEPVKVWASSILPGFARQRASSRRKNATAPAARSPAAA